jgi:hypothetical protein
MGRKTQESLVVEMVDMVEEMNSNYVIPMVVQSVVYIYTLPPLI